MKNSLEKPPQFQDPEEAILARLRQFRLYLRNFADKENDSDLQALNFNKITEEDMVFFQRFQMGMFSLQDVERQEQFLSGMIEGKKGEEDKPLKEADTAIKLLHYMRKKLTKQETRAA